jgi:hypothetical protein
VSHELLGVPHLPIPLPHPPPQEENTGAQRG